MAYIAGRKSDESLVEILLKRPEWTIDDVTIDKRTKEILNTQEEINAVPEVYRREITGLKTVIPINHGGQASDYSFHKMTQNEEDRIRNGDSYSLIWIANEVTGIDFSLEDAKLYLKIYSDKAEIDGDGNEEAQITFEFWKTDKSAIDTSINIISKIPIFTPNKHAWINISIVNGTATEPFKTTEYGKWIFPSELKRFENVRVLGNRLEIEVIAIGIP